MVKILAHQIAHPLSVCIPESVGECVVGCGVIVGVGMVENRPRREVNGASSSSCEHNSSHG